MKVQRVPFLSLVVKRENARKVSLQNVSVGREGVPRPRVSLEGQAIKFCLMNAFLSHHEAKLRVSERPGSEAELQMPLSGVRWRSENVAIHSTDWHLQICSLIKGPERRQQFFVEQIQPTACHGLAGCFSVRD